MKELKKLSLHNFTEVEMAKREQDALKGGIFCICTCGCKYAGEQEGPDDDCYGGSSKKDNKSANNSSKSFW